MGQKLKRRSITIRLGDIHEKLNPHPKQREILEDPHRFKVVDAGRRFGKTQVSLMAGVSRVLTRPPGSEIWIVSPSHGQQETMWNKALETLAGAKHELFVRKGNPSGRFVRNIYSTRGHRHFRLYNGSIIYFKSGWDPDSLLGGGDRLEFAILDEASRLRPTVWRALRFGLMDKLAGAMFISTPNSDDPRNWFFERWLWGQQYIEQTCATCDGDGCSDCDWTGVVTRANPLKKPDYRSWRFSSYDNPHITDEEINRLIEEEGFSHADIQREIYGEFVESEGAVFSLQEIQDCEQGEFLPPSPDCCYVMGIDFGQVEDYTVAVVINLDTAHVDALERFQGGWGLQFERLQALYHSYGQPFTALDATQLGGSVIEHELRKLGMNNIRGYRFNGPSKQRLIEGLSVAVERNDISFPYHPEIRREFLAFTAQKLPSGHLRYRASGGEHDDVVDAMALAWEAYRTKTRRRKQRAELFTLGVSP